MGPLNGFRTSNSIVGSKLQWTIRFHERTNKKLAFMKEIIWLFNLLEKWLYMITFSINGKKHFLCHYFLIFLVIEFKDWFIAIKMATKI